MHDLVNTSVAYRVFYLTLLGLGIIFAAIVLVSGIGLLKMSNRARTLVITYAVCSILITIAANVVDVFALYAPMWAQMGQQAEEQQIITIVYHVRRRRLGDLLPDFPDRHPDLLFAAVGQAGVSELARDSNCRFVVTRFIGYLRRVAGGRASASAMR